MIKRPALILVVLAAACGGSNAPSVTAPTPQPAPAPAAQSRVIALSGPVAFGQVLVGSTASAPLTISNAGTSPLTFTGIGGGFADTTVSQTSGTIAAGSSTTLTFRFSPSSAGARTGTLTINGDFTSGNNATTMTGTGVAVGPPSAAGTWVGRATGSNCQQSGPLGGTDYCHDNANIGGPITMVLAQAVTGDVVGTVTFIDYRANVSGSLNGSRLQINGTGNSGFLDHEYAAWNTTINGNAMTGTFTFRFSAKNPGGFVAWTMTLANVTRTGP